MDQKDRNHGSPIKAITVIIIHVHSNHIQNTVKHSLEPCLMTHSYRYHVAMYDSRFHLKSLPHIMQ